MRGVLSVKRLSLLLVGAGAGGPAIAIARQLGALVSGFEADPALAASAAGRVGRSGLGKRMQIGTWDPGRPVFPLGAYHHGLALEPLGGVHAEPVLAAIAAAVRPGGQLILLQTIADLPLHPAEAGLAGGEAPDLPTEASITRMLGRLGFEVRAMEDLSERQAHLAVLGWRDAVRRLNKDRPPPPLAALLMQEAEAWSQRLDLFRLGRLRLLRWHANRKGVSVVATPPSHPGMAAPMAAPMAARVAASG